MRRAHQKDLQSRKRNDQTIAEQRQEPWIAKAQKTTQGRACVKDAYNEAEGHEDASTHEKSTEKPHKKATTYLSSILERAETSHGKVMEKP